MKEKPVKIVSLPYQIFILLWKNGILFRRNIFGTLLEVFCPLLFLSILLIMRYFIEKIKYYDQYNFSRSIFDVFIEPPQVSLTALSQIEEDRSNRNLIFYYPDTEFIRNIVTNAAKLLQDNNKDFRPQILASNVPIGKDLDTTLLVNMFGFVSFPYTSANSLPNDVEYTIYTQEEAMQQYKINSIFPSFLEYYYTKAPENICHDNTYFTLYSAFNALKYSVDLQIINRLTGTTINNPDLLRIAQYNCPAYIQDDMISFFGFFITIVMTVAYIFTMLVTVGNTVTEKATKMKEYLKLIGVKWQAIWIASWFRSMIFYLLLSILIATFTKITLEPNSKNFRLINKAILMNTDFMVIFSLLIIYSVQVSIFNLLLAQFFNSPFNARIFSLVLWMFTSINFYNSLPSVLKYFLCFFPNLAFTFSMQVIFQFERSHKELTFGQLYTNLFKDPLNVGSVMLVMILCSFIYLVISWYLEKILPGDYGVPLPFYFPFTRSYWFPKNLRINPSELANSRVNQYAFEREPSDLKRTVSIQNMSKSFNTKFKSKKEAVKNLSFNFYENQVTGIIGHNGAGKTTTTLMLCGLYPPTSGTANILGYDLCYEIDKIHSILGFCPQYDILYDDLTAEEHLKLIALIKGYSIKEIEKEVARIANLVGLNNDLTKRAIELSGGMKRRLMVGMAFTGDSKIIILDEPTSGLDPFNRLKFWELIRSYKKGRTIILTTHFMEEVDALSDRVGIMNHGSLMCCGSPLFLKNFYGTGFRIKIFKNELFSQLKLESLLGKHIENYNIETNVAHELCISIPFIERQVLPMVLNNIEENKNNIGMDTYSVSSSTMEEVFLKVGKIDKVYESVQRMDAKNVDEKYFESLKETAFLKHGKDLWLQQILTLLSKRFLIFYRRYILASTMLLFPCLLQIIICILVPSMSVLDASKNVAPIKDLGRLDLNIDNYGATNLPYSILSRPDEPGRFDQLFNQFYAQRDEDIQLEKVGDVPNTVFQEKKSFFSSIYTRNFLGMSFNVSMPFNENTSRIVGYYSTMAYHSIGIVANEVTNFLLFMLSQDSPVTRQIVTYNSPLSSNSSKYQGDDFVKFLGCFDILPLSLFNFLTSLTVAFIMSFILMHVAKEKINGSKDLQLLSGTHQTIYWISNYIFDYAICLYNICLLIIIIAAVGAMRDTDLSSDVSIIAEWPTIGYVILIFFLSSLTWPVYGYCWSFFFKSDVTAFVVLLLLLSVATFLDVIFSFIQIFTHITDQSLSADSALPLIMYALRILLSIFFPNVTSKRQLFDLRLRSNNYCIDILNNIVKTNYKYNTPYADFNEPGIGAFIVILFMQMVMCILLFIGLESKALDKEFLKKLCRSLCRKQTTYKDEDHLKLEKDVEEESLRLKNSNLEKLSRREPLVVNRLVKMYKKNRVKVKAVNQLSFGVQRQQCFGLLGLNGAGKTSTFKMVTGESEPDFGDVLIDGYSIRARQFSARKNLGYCPQFDKLPEYLTVNETLTLFSKLRGSFSTEKIVNDALNVFQLNEFENSLVQNLSGGNKRKLSSAIAFLGKPSVVILDEPSTGMDPGARKFLWNIIKKARDLGMCIVLSSHSMEECEALCDKLGIMLSGQLECFGSINHIKEKYGDGYRLVIKCKHDEQIVDSTNRLESFILNNFINYTLEDKQHETLFFKLKKFSHINTKGNKIQTIAEVFSILETNKDLLNIESYLLSETTLEQIFMSFAKHSNPSDKSNDLADETIFTTFNSTFNSTLSKDQSVAGSLRNSGYRNLPVLMSFQGVDQRLPDNELNTFSFFKKLRRQFKKRDYYEVKF